MTSQEPLPIHLFPETACLNLTHFFMDIDDTFTTDGLITSDAYQALWRLFESGIKVVPVTGRPAGWCDLIARMWPVDAVIGENGAFYFCYNRHNRQMERHYFQSKKDRAEGVSRLKTLQERVLANVPGCGISADQPFRIADLAIDFCEDVPRLPESSIDAICEFAHELNLTFKVSSIHVNCWYGDFDKLTSLKSFLSTRYDRHLDDLQQTLTFIGDSPNDEPMFSAIRQSIAVANICDFMNRLTYRPAYITQNSSGEGFCEAVDVILKKREGL